MSITGSLLGYENNNEICNPNNKNFNNNKKQQQKQQQQQIKQTRSSSTAGVQQQQQQQLQHYNNNKSNNSIKSTQSTTASVSSSFSSMGKNCPSSLNSSFSNSIIIGGSGPPVGPLSSSTPLQHKYMNSKRKHATKYNSMASGHHRHHSSASSHLIDHNNYLHLNSLWSIWYGVLLTLFQGYLAVHGAYRFLGCSLIPWKIEPVAELNLQIVLSGVVFILLPLFFTSAVFKVGNLANDGIKLAAGTKRRCSITPADGLEEEARGGTLRALWTHGGPTAAFVHIVIAMCLLLPRLLLEARIIENGLLPKENIWQTELDFIAVNRRNLVVLSVITAPYQNMTSIEDASNDEDYFNDTMFTAIGNGINNNNNLLETTNPKDKKSKQKQKQQQANGKTRFFEVPDLINRAEYESNEDKSKEQQKARKSDGGFGRGGGGRIVLLEESDEGDSKEKHKHEFDKENDDDDGDVDDNATPGDSDDEKFLFGKQQETNAGRADSKQSYSNIGITVEQFDYPTAASTSMPLKELSTISGIETISQQQKNMAFGKNYDKNWDKLGTIGKENSLGGTFSKATPATTTTTGTTTSTSSTTMTKSSSSSTSTTARTTLTYAATTNAAMTSTDSMSSTGSTSNAGISSTKLTPTTTKFIASTATQATTLPTLRSHHHHQHHGKSRKHGSRQHHHQHHQHRQRGQNARRHHATSSTTSTSTTATSAAGININRFDGEFDTFGNGNGNAKTKPIYPMSNSYDEDEANDYGRARAYFPKSTSAISTTLTTRDSNIHIVKPEMLPPEIIPSTPLTSNSKIIEIKTKSKKLVKRMADDAELQVEIEPEYLIGDLPGGASINGDVVYTDANLNMSESNNDSSSEYVITSSSLSSLDDVDEQQESNAATPFSINNDNVPVPPTQPASNAPIVRLDGFAGMLQIFFGIEKPIDVTTFAHPPSAEFVNLIFALLVWCVRYPAVFWAATKPFATIFSVQMIAAALDIIFGYIGIENLYKLQVYSEAMPIQNPGLILNGIVTLALYLLSTVLILASSMIMYLYGHGRLAAKMRDRSLITLKASETWIYFAHCASLCFVLALAVVKAPLLNDLSATYKNNLHCPTFLSALISVVHLLLWIVIWLGLTAKRRWTFKLPPIDTYGLTKATTQPLLMASNRGSIPSSGSSSISGSGSDPKGVISNTTTTSTDGSGGGGGVGGVSVSNTVNTGVGCGGNGNGVGHNGCGAAVNAAPCVGGNANNAAATDDIYWPKLAPNSPKLKVTFNEVTSTSDDDVLLIDDGEQQQKQQQHEQMFNDGNKRNQIRGTQICFAGATGEIDEGEYATLRAATAATVVGIGINVKTANQHKNGGGSAVRCGGGALRRVSNEALTPTNGSISIMGSVQILQLSEYDELPPPPPMLTQQHQQQQHQNNNNNNNNNTFGTSTATISGIVGDYANLSMGMMGAGTSVGLVDDNISEEGGKLLECVRDDSVTYASTRGLDPPQPPPPPPPPTMQHDTHGKNINNNNNNNNSSNHTFVAVSAGRAPQAIPENMQLSSSPEHSLVSPLAPVTVTVHTNEAHIHPSSTPRCLRRADSGVPNEALTPRSDTTSTTESTISPPERAPSESSSGVHSGEERDVEVVIRPRVGCKPPAKPPQPAIQEEPYGRCTNMRMSSFVADPMSTSRVSGINGTSSSSATLPLTRSTPDSKFDYTSHCSTMPLPVGCHSQLNNATNGYSSSSAQSMIQQQQQPQNVSTFKSMYANSAVAMSGANSAATQQQQQQQLHQQLQQHLQLQQQHQQLQQSLHTTLPNGVRYSNPQHFLRRLPHVTKAAESPYGHLGLGAGHHTFSKLLHDPLHVSGNSLANSVIPEDRDSANYSMSSDYDTNLYATANHLN